MADDPRDDARPSWLAPLAILLLGVVPGCAGI